MSVESAMMIEEEELEVPVSKTEGGSSAMKIEGNQGPMVPDLNDPSVDMGENNAADPIGMENGEPAADVKPTETEPSKMYEKYRECATNAKREDLAVKLQETEDWLYEEGEDETKGVYVAKLVELKKLGDPIEERFKEEEVRGPCVEQLLYCINSFQEATISKDPKFNHIDLAEKEKVVMECNIVEDWLRDKGAQQEHVPRSANPVLLCVEVKNKMEALDR